MNIGRSAAASVSGRAILLSLLFGAGSSQLITAAAALDVGGDLFKGTSVFATDLPSGAELPGNPGSGTN